MTGTLFSNLINLLFFCLCINWIEERNKMVTRLLLLAVIYFYGIAAQYNQKYAFSQYSLSVTQ